MLRTFQDFEQAADVSRFLTDAIATYTQSDLYRTARTADRYDAQRNITITETIPTIFNVAGEKVQDYTVSNHHIANNLFNRLNTQRCMYSLANGVSFVDPYEAGQVDETKLALGPHFDHDLIEAGYYALIHGVSYMLWDLDRAYVLKATEFVPLDDEHDGTLRAGIRFWRLDQSRPLNVVLYEEDGFTAYRQGRNGLEVTQDKRPYRMTYRYTESDGQAVPVAGENYGALPVVRMYGSRLHQSTLVGMREALDAYDIIKSGLANDMADCAQVYWIVENYGGMTDDDLRQFLDRLKLNHVANADTQAGGKVTPYAKDVPYQSRREALAEIRNGIYEDFGALDVHTVAAGATNDHIDAAYQPMDENAADFEHWVGEAVTQLLALLGIEDTPVFQRNRISNQQAQVEMVVQEAQWLDQATVLRKLPNITPDEASAIMLGSEREDIGRFGGEAE